MFIKEFLNENSLISPTIAAALTMVFSNALWFLFGLPQKWIALIISGLFVIGMVASPLTFSILRKVIYQIFNILIVFTMAMGMNSYGNLLPNKEIPPRYLNAHENINAIGKPINSLENPTTLEPSINPLGNPINALHEKPDTENNNLNENKKREFFTNWLK
jgi:hypothetical protein